jgi:hypothetical protein
MRRPHAAAASATAATTPPRTSLVHEFRCLYTADVQRKHKRWRDGTLRFHAFNARVVVYDAGGGYVGDGHWPRGVPPPMGEEVEHLRFAEGEVLLQLMNGVLVQVEEARGSSVTDLTPLFERRMKEEEGGAPTIVREEVPRRRNPQPPKDRSLRAILDARSATGGAGSARSAPPVRRPPVEPPRSPPQQFRPRLEQAKHMDSEPSRKRQRRDPPEERPDIDADDDVVELSVPPQLTSSVEIPPTPTRRGTSRPAMAPPQLGLKPTGTTYPKPPADPPPRPLVHAVSAPIAPVERAPRRMGITRPSTGAKPWKPPQPLSDPPPQPRSDPPPSSPPSSAEDVFRNIDDFDLPTPVQSRPRLADSRAEVVSPGLNPNAKPLRLMAAKPKPKLLCLQPERVWRVPQPEPELDVDPISDYSSSGSAFTDS